MKLGIPGIILFFIFGLSSPLALAQENNCTLPKEDRSLKQILKSLEKLSTQEQEPLVKKIKKIIPTFPTLPALLTAEQSLALWELSKEKNSPVISLEIKGTYTNLKFEENTFRTGLAFQRTYANFEWLPNQPGAPEKFDLSFSLKQRISEIDFKEWLMKNKLSKPVSEANVGDWVSFMKASYRNDLNDKPFNESKARATAGFIKLSGSNNEAEFKDALNEMKKGNFTSEEIEATLGLFAEKGTGPFSHSYDQNRAKNWFKWKDQAPTTAQITQGIRNDTPSFVCRDMMTLVGQSLKTLGYKNVYFVAFNSFSEPHTTLVAEDPKNPNRKIKMDYGDVQIGKLNTGTNGLLQMGDVSNSYYIYQVNEVGTPGRAITVQQSDLFKKVLAEAAGPDSVTDFNPAATQALSQSTSVKLKIREDAKNASAISLGYGKLPDSRQFVFSSFNQKWGKENSTFTGYAGAAYTYLKKNPIINVYTNEDGEDFRKEVNIQSNLINVFLVQKIKTPTIETSDSRKTKVKFYAEGTAALDLDLSLTKDGQTLLRSNSSLKDQPTLVGGFFQFLPSTGVHLEVSPNRSTEFKFKAIEQLALMPTDSRKLGIADNALYHNNLTVSAEGTHSPIPDVIKFGVAGLLNYNAVGSTARTSGFVEVQNKNKMIESNTSFVYQTPLKPDMMRITEGSAEQLRVSEKVKFKNTIEVSLEYGLLNPSVPAERSHLVNATAEMTLPDLKAIKIQKQKSKLHQ